MQDGLGRQGQEPTRTGDGQSRSTFGLPHPDPIVQGYPFDRGPGGPAQGDPTGRWHRAGRRADRNAPPAAGTEDTDVAALGKQRRGIRSEIDAARPGESDDPVIDFIDNEQVVAEYSQAASPQLGQEGTLASAAHTEHPPCLAIADDSAGMDRVAVNHQLRTEAGCAR